MTPSEVSQVLDELQARAGTADIDARAGYFVERVGAPEPGTYLGFSTEGQAALIVASTKSQIPPQPLRLASISVDYGVESHLWEATAEQSLRVTVIRCTASEPGIIEAFTAMCGALVNVFVTKRTEREVAEEIRRWSVLFWRLQERVETDVVGLCGELVAITASDKPDSWISAWHSRPDALLDFEFSHSHLSVEVKATRSDRRRHTFSPEQVRERDGVTGYLASVPVRFVEAGTSLGTMVRDLSDRLDHDSSRLRLWDILSRTCGAGLDDFLARTLDREFALQGLFYFAVSSIPAPLVEMPLPKGVVQVKFTADLDLSLAVESSVLDDLVDEDEGEPFA